MTSPPAGILAIDGTLVDTNHQHAVAWFRAFRRLDVTLPLYRVHRHRRAGLATVGVLTGGFSDEELRAAGASCVFERIQDLLDRLDETPLSTV